jgi:hypothetical protein
MRITVFKSILVAALAVVASLPAAAQYRFSGVERVVAMSDPHGAYDGMVRTLTHAGLVDSEGNWSGGETHLVITGDLLDRGADSRKIMDLVMQLEAQAPEAGGMVHLTLGNHEVMNLVGDLRYVAAGEFAAFADEESAEEREKWFQAFLSERRLASESEVDEAALRQEFDERRPPGFYAHRRAFGSEGKYGRWLMQKPLLVVVNDTAFVHGGLSPVVAELGLDRLNDEMRGQVVDYVLAFEALSAAGLIDPAVNFYDHAAIAEALLADENTPAGLREAMTAVVELNDAPVHDSIGPIWYRGNVGCSILTEGEVLDASLAAIGASRVVIGHTPTVGRHVLERFGGKVIEVDTGMLTAAYGGSGFALIIEADGLSVAQETETSRTVPVAHPRRVGDRPDSLDAEALENLLATGEIVSTNTDDNGRVTVEISGGGHTVSAVFTRSPRKKGLEPEIAAYRIDRLIGADMVPVTVTREVDGRRGSLQFLPPRARDEMYRSTTGQGGSAWCPLQRQWNSMYIFDVLVNNNGRTPGSMVYNTSNWQFMSMGHDQAFGTRGDRPAYLRDMTIDVTTAWVDALNELTDERLNEALTDLLSKRQIGALADRRDELLEAAE